MKTWRQVVESALRQSDREWRLPVNERKRHRDRETLDKIGFWCLWFLTKDLD